MLDIIRKIFKKIYFVVNYRVGIDSVVREKKVTGYQR